MIKGLFVSQYTVEYDGTFFYDNGLNSTYGRYLAVCDRLTVLTSINRVPIATSSKVNCDKLSIIGLEKINSLGKLLKYSKINNRIIEDEVKKTDFCIMHLPSSAGNYAIKCALKYNKPFITVIVGCTWDSLWNYDWRGKLLAPIEFVKMRYWQKKSLYSIYVTKSFLQKRYPMRGRSINCSNVDIHVDSNALKKRLATIQSKTKNKSKLKIGTCAAIDVPYKGQEYVIAALGKLREFGVEYEYHLIGSGKRTRLLKIAESNHVSSNVFFHGQITHNEVISFLDDIDIYIQPSKQEGLPRALIEAMSRGCLCIGSNIAGIPELLDEKWMFKKGNVYQLVEKLKSFSVSDLENAAIRNFNKSKEYDNTIINERRFTFLSDFVKSCSLEYCGLSKEKDLHPFYAMENVEDKLS